MIVTVTMNPALDKTAELDKFEHASLNRLKHVEVDPGGKGINVSKTLMSFGMQSIATGFLGGNTGRYIEEMLQKQGIQTDFVYVDSETRTNMKVVEPHGILTELNEPGPTVGEEAIHALKHKLQEIAGPEVLFVLSGSVPAGTDSMIYADIIRCVKNKGAKVLLDADGPLFEHALVAQPDIIKPNRFELEQYFQVTTKLSEQEIVSYAKKLRDKGIGMVAVTLGGEGAIFILQDKIVRADGLQVEAHSTVGAGDAMVAALAYGIDKKLDDETCIRLAMATSAGAVMTVGTKPPTWEQIKELESKVKMTEFE
ncbi:MAG TPA: 1-phosphofructokinase [Lachnospiraceae bacterium]|jgi:1-phosphofructokinase|nr:1-phosphofructokinase [Lachnospiraceae bacterium]